MWGDGGGARSYVGVCVRAHGSCGEGGVHCAVVLDWPFGKFIVHVLGAGVVLQCAGEGYHPEWSDKWIAVPKPRPGELSLEALEQALRWKRGLPARPQPLLRRKEQRDYARRAVAPAPQEVAPPRFASLGYVGRVLAEVFP